MDVTGSWNSSYGHDVNDWHAVIKYMKNGKIPFEKLITREYSLKESNKAFNYLMNKNTQKFKVVFKIDEN